MMFPETELLGVDLVTPDLTYLRDNRQHVRALVLTHGHEDHIGAVPFFLTELNLPVYGTAFTLGLVARRRAALRRGPGERPPRGVRPAGRGGSPRRGAEADPRDRRFQDRVYSRDPLDRERAGTGHHDAGRGGDPHGRFQGRSDPHR